MTTTSYLAKFGINGNLTNHHFDPCPISGRCAVCGVAPNIHPVGPIRKRGVK